MQKNVSIKKIKSYVTYCRICGMLKVKMDTNYYDIRTGRKVRKTTCVNKKCSEYCKFFGHQYVGFWLWSHCINCRIYKHAENFGPMTIERPIRAIRVKRDKTSERQSGSNQDSLFPRPWVS